LCFEASWTFIITTQVTILQTLAADSVYMFINPFQGKGYNREYLEYGGKLKDLGYNAV
jgi:hypothetical protein